MSTKRDERNTHSTQCTPSNDIFVHFNFKIKHLLCDEYTLYIYMCIFLIFIHNHWPLSLFMLAAMKIFSFFLSQTDIRHKVSGISAMVLESVKFVQNADTRHTNILDWCCRRCYFSDGISNHCQI